MRVGEPLRDGGKLLVADQRILGADEIVLRLVDGERVLGGAEPVLKFLEPSRQIVGGAPRGIGLRLLGFREISGGHRIGEHRGFGRDVRPDLDIDHIGAVGPLDVDVTVQGVQRGHLAAVGIGRRSAAEADQAQQRPHQAVGLAAEFRIAVELGVFDDAQQDVVRGDQARLTFDHHRQARNVLRARGQFAVHQLQFPRVDIKLGGCRVSRRETLADHDCRAGANQRRRHDCNLAPPQYADQVHHVEARRAARRRRCGVRDRRLYRLVICEHGPLLSFLPACAPGEGLLFATNHSRPVPMRNRRDREN